ncbi:hypothetical protein HMPREF3033_00600 [Veillonellaceae bacterium DNF00751]|nr:hypothetical protein HMPREF3033_00600 [Veillonellaceae bacterium DNF00751]
MSVSKRQRLKKEKNKGKKKIGDTNEIVIKQIMKLIILNKYYVHK